MNQIAVKPERKKPDSGFHLTQAEIAKRFGVSRAMIFLIEKRALRKIRLAIVREAAAAGVTPRTWLFGD